MTTTIYPAQQGPADRSPVSEGDKLLERIRKRFDYMVKAWKEIRDEAENDQRALSRSGPWTDDDRDQRVRDKRPCLHLDQLTQYVNSLVNEVRSNPIGIKINPGGEGASEKTAELRANRIRAIEYESNAVQAYQCAFESAASMSYGAVGVVIDYKSWDSFQRVIKVRRFANQHAVIWDPDTKEADASDMQDCFVLDRVQKDVFKERYADATVTSFGEEEMRIAPSWFDDDSVQVAEYWYVEKKKRRMFLVDEGGSGSSILRMSWRGTRRGRGG